MEGFRLLRRDKKRVPFIEHFCDTGCIFIKEVKSWCGVGASQLQLSLLSFQRLTVTVKRESGGCNSRVSIVRFFLGLPPFVALLKLVWSGCCELKQSLHDSTESARSSASVVQRCKSVICRHHWLEVSFSGLWAEGEIRAPPPQLNQNPELRSRAGWRCRGNYKNRKKKKGSEEKRE